METFFASRGIPLENLRQTCLFCPFLVYLSEKYIVIIYNN